MRTCGLIRQKMINGKISYIVEHVKWNAFLSHYEVYDVEISTSKFTIVTDNKKGKDTIFNRIGVKSSSSYTKASTQYNNQFLPPLINMRLLSNVFLNSISTDVIETINWSENERVSIPAIYKVLLLSFRNLYLPVHLHLLLHLHLRQMTIHLFLNLYILLYIRLILILLI